MGFIKNLSESVRRAFAERPTVASARREMGRPGTSIFSGFITEDYNSDFHGQGGVEIYEKMRKGDATVNGVLTAMKLPILQAERTIESADSNDELQNEIADYVRRNLFVYLEGGFSNFMRELLGYLDFGYYPFEKVYEIRDGMVYIKKLSPRKPSSISRWTLTSDPTKPGITQQLPTTVAGLDTTTPEIPMEKLVLFTHNKEGDNHEGVSVLRSAYKHWYFKDNLYRIDGIRLERGAGVLKIKLPDGASDDDKADAEELGENFKINEAAFIVQPNPNWEIELMTAGIADQSGALIESVRHHDRMIAINILAQFMDLGSGGGGGSYALSKDQSSFFLLNLRSIADYIANTINEQLVKEIVILNYGEQEEYPKLRFGDIGEVDFGETATALKTLIDAGVVEVSPEIKAWAHKTFKLPELVVSDFESEEDEELNNLVADLALLEAEIAGLPGQSSDTPVDNSAEGDGTEDMSDDEIMEKAKDLPPEEQDALGLTEHIFGAKGEPLSDETKKKISEALKKGGTAKEGTLTNKFQKDADISGRVSNIDDAKRRIVELRAVVTGFRETSKTISDSRAKKAFNATIKAKVEEIRIMIAAGLSGIKSERGKIEDRKDVVREEHNQDKAMEKETKVRDRMRSKQEKLDEKMEKARSSLMKAKTKDAQDRIRNRMEEMQDEHDEIDAQLRSPKPLSLAERTYFRKLTLAEDRVKLAEIDDFFTEMEQDVMDRLRIASDDQREELLREAEKIIDGKDIAAIVALALGSVSGLSSDIKNLAKSALEEGKRTASNELDQSLPTTPSSRTKIANTRVDLLLEERAAEILGTMKKKMLDIIQKGVGKAQAVNELAKAYDDISNWWNSQITGRIVIDSFDDGRDLVFDTYRGQVYGLQRSEILDMKTCQMCLSLDERIISATDPFGRIGQIHTNCRGIWVALLKTDAVLPKVKSIPKTILNRFDTVEGVPFTNDFTQMKNPVINKGSRAGKQIGEDMLDNPHV